MNVTKIDRCGCGHAMEACPKRRLNVLLALLPYRNEPVWQQLTDTERALLDCLRATPGKMPSAVEIAQLEAMAKLLGAEERERRGA